MENHESEKTGDADDGSLGRRPFLGSIGAIGAAGALSAATEIGTASHVDEWPEPDDPYYAQLVDDLREMGLPPAEFVYADDETEVWNRHDVTGEGTFATVGSLDVSDDDVPFAEASRIEVHGEVENDWDVNIRADVDDRRIDGGDVLLGVVYFRTPDGDADVEYQARYAAEFSNEVQNGSQPDIGPEWERYYFRIEYGTGADAGDWWTETWLGFGEQTVDIGGIALLDFGQDVDTDQLPAWDVETSDVDDASGEWPDPDDPYYAQLVRALEQSGLPPAQFVYGDTEADTAAVYDVHGSAESESLDVSDEDVPFSEAVRIDVASEVDNPWEAGMIGTVEDRAVGEGDVLLGVAYLRAPDGKATVQYTAKDENNESTNMVRSPQPPLGEEWQRYFFPIRFDYGSAPGTWWTEFFLGYEGQTVDVGGLALLDFGQDVDPDDLPSWDEDHDVPETWEEAADQRIRDLRTTDLSVRVANPEGLSVNGAQVSVSQQSHEFAFGTAVNAQTLLEESEEGDEYREYIPGLFNTAVLENRHKWRFFEEQQDLADEAVDWILEQGLDLRGHACLGGSRDGTATPADVREAIDAGDADTVRQRSMDHIEAIISHYGDDVEEWNVVDGAINEPGLIEAIDGSGVDPAEAPVLADWYQQAREVAPEGTTLAVNDYDTLAGSHEETREAYERQIEFLDGQNAGLDTAGLRSHFDENTTLTPWEIMTRLDRYAAHDVRLQITEFDTADDGWSDSAKAEYLHQFLKTVFSHDAIDGFVMWGFWDGCHWQDDAPLFSDDWSEKPAYDVYTDLVFDEWWTEETGETNDRGRYDTAAFEGEYVITVRYGDVEKTVTTSVSGDEKVVSVRLDVDQPDDSGTEDDSGDDDTADTERDTTGGDDSDEEETVDGDDDEESDDSAEGLPGFGVVTGLAGLAGLAGYALSRGDDEDAGRRA